MEPSIEQFLPKELFQHVLSFLDPREVQKCAVVNSFWCSFANDPFVWRNLCRENGWEEENEEVENWKAAYFLRSRIGYSSTAQHKLVYVSYQNRKEKVPSI